MIPDAPGTYVLILNIPFKNKLHVGKLGCISFPSGFYAYVGSAMGPGGLKARLNHHLKTEKSPHWHIDYLTLQPFITQIWYTICPEKVECTWSKNLSYISGEILHRKFGASDCQCLTHFYYFKAFPDLAAFKKKCNQKIQQLSAAKLSVQPF